MNIRQIIIFQTFIYVVDPYLSLHLVRLIQFQSIYDEVWCLIVDRNRKLIYIGYTVDGLVES